MHALEWEQLGVATLFLALGACVQSSLGFGMGIVAIPLLVNHGCSLPIALGVLMPNVLLQTSLSCWRIRQHLPWRESWQIVFWRLLALPFGVYLLQVVSTKGLAASRMLLGTAILCLLLVPMGGRSHDDDRQPLGHAWTCLAGLSSGVLMGLIGMGGPPLMAWVMRQGWPNQRQRGFLWLSFLLALPFQVALMTWQFGDPWLRGFMIGSCAIPIVFIVSWIIGSWADQWSRDRLQWGMRLFLFLLALRLIFFPGQG